MKFLLSKKSWDCCV